MKNKEFLDFARKELDAIMAIIEAKNADYTGGGGAFANFEVTEKLGLSDAKTGLLIRLVDKVQRIKSFVQKGELKVKGESAQDAARDIIGYGLVLLGMLEQGKAAAAPQELMLKVGKRYRRRDGKVVRLKRAAGLDAQYAKFHADGWLYDEAKHRSCENADLTEELPE